jgi:hypothetical protein
LTEPIDTSLHGSITKTPSPTLSIVSSSSSALKIRINNSNERRLKPYVAKKSTEKTIKNKHASTAPPTLSFNRHTDPSCLAYPILSKPESKQILVNAYSHTQLPPQSRQPNGHIHYYPCQWLCGGSTLCSQKFNSIEALNEHLRNHTTNELLSDLTRYFYARTTLLQSASSSLASQYPYQLFPTLPYPQYVLMTNVNQV